MRFILLLFITTLCNFAAFAQTPVKLGHVRGHIGDSVIVCGKVEGGKYLPGANNSPTLINLGYDYPNQLLTVVIFGEHRSLFNGSPETDWLNKTICVRGKVELYRDKPQIVVRNANQVSIED